MAFTFPVASYLSCRKADVDILGMYLKVGWLFYVVSYI